MSGLVSAFRILREREKARESFWEFCNQTVFKRLPRRVPARHHEVACKYIQDLADDPEGGILIILMPPGGAKTLLAGRALPAWVLGRDPGCQVLMVTNTMPLAEKNGRAIREILQMPAYQHIFDSTLSPSSSAAASFGTTNGGDFFGVGSAGAALGRRGNWVIIDDPISGFEEAQSETQMAKLRDAFEANILTRLVPGAKVVLIQQRLARNDLAGYLIDRASKPETHGGRKTTVLRMPMLCDDPANDPLGRAEGEPLWPEYWTQGMIIDAQANAYKWKTLYQQSPPSSEGTWADAQDVQVSPMPRGVANSDEWRIYMGCDIAYSVNKGDFTVFVVVAFHKKTGAMHIVDLYRKQVDNAISADALIEMVKVWKPNWIGIDNDIGSQGFVSHLKTRAAYEHVNLRMETVPMRGKAKEARAGALRAKIKSGFLHVDRSAPWAEAVIQEIRMFPNGVGDGVDDIIDALGLIAGKTPAMVLSHATVEDPDRPDPDGYHLNGLFEDNERDQRVRRRIL